VHARWQHSFKAEKFPTQCQSTNLVIHICSHTLHLSPVTHMYLDLCKLTVVAAPCCCCCCQVEASSTNPALYYPGWLGGGIFHNGRLLCRCELCTVSWRTVCIGHPSGCMQKRCRYVNARNGAVCDVNPCIQGLCWNGVCMGGGPTTCPNHPEECMQVIFNSMCASCEAAASAAGSTTTLRPQWYAVLV
jgi:hypothetical protein